MALVHTKQKEWVTLRDGMKLELLVRESGTLVTTATQTIETYISPDRCMGNPIADSLVM